MADDAMSGLKDDGRQGVHFDPEVATTMAQQCASMLSVVDAAIRAVQPTTSLKPLSQKAPNDSGHQLADKFNAAAKNLVDTVLKDHQSVLTSMGEAFVAAGKLYIGTDEASKDAIQNGKFTDQQLSGAFQDYRGGGGQPGLADPNIPVESLDMPGWKQSEYGQWWQYSNSTDGYSYSGTAKQDYDNKLADTSQIKHLMDDLVKQAGVTIDPYPIAPETSAVYEWNDFHNHWKYIKDNDLPGQLETYAQAWHKAQTYLKVQAQTFESATNKYLQPFQGNTADIDKIWASPAAKQAKDAITKYLASVKTLVTSMDVMAVNLADTQGWVKRLQNFLPYKSFQEEYPPGTWVYQSNVDAFVKDMKRAWDAWYVVGVQDSSGAIPIMPSPKSALDIKPPEVKLPTDQPDPNSKQPTYSPTTQTPSTQTPNLDNLKPVDDKPTNTDPKDTDPKNTNTPTTTTDTTLQTLITQASTVLQAGITAAEQGVEKLASAVETALTQTQTNTKTTEPTDQLTQQLQNLGLIPNSNNPSGSPTGGSPSGSPTSPGSPQTPKTQLSPRAATPTSTTETDSETATTSRAGLASSSSSSSSSTGSTGGMGGSPMAAGSQSQSKEHKRPQFLTNLENMEQVLGEAPAAVTPVAEK
ncbi:hypothetical protein VMT65_18400 [Nocardia sp. CDC153]|uniref:hypothetical protein n=1 Tax=Nocardia sp. CDC153 TaxID=3112167 RepID=UPI002DBD8504|nr:hypothetical protein [Nocardia sp. CDC153]MEC3955019.1 hypothetical protein [Nocardia sp. CDC153]